MLRSVSNCKIISNKIMIYNKKVSEKDNVKRRSGIFRI